MKITAKKFYNLFLKEVKKTDKYISWGENKKWTRRLLSGRSCVMEKIANKLNLHYCHEYFFFRRDFL